MSYIDRIVFASTQTALMLKLQDAGILGITENQITLLPGVAGWSYIGEPYGDGLSYALVTFDGATDMVEMDARLVGNIDPSRTPLRVAAGTVIDDPDAVPRAAFLTDEIHIREKRFQREKDLAGVEKVSRYQLRKAALQDSPAMLATLDQSVVDSTSKPFKLKWEEHGEFSRVNLNNTTLTANQKDTLFAAALLI